MAKRKPKSKLQKQFEKQSKRIKETIRRYRQKNIFIDYEIPKYKKLSSKNIETLKKINLDYLMKKNKVFYADINTGVYKKLTYYELEKIRSKSRKKRIRYRDDDDDFYNDYDYPEPKPIEDTVLRNVEGILNDARNKEVADWILNAIEEEINYSSRQEVALRFQTYGNIYALSAADDAGNASDPDDIEEGFKKLLEIIRDREPYDSDIDFITEYTYPMRAIRKHRNYYGHQFHTGRRI